MSDVFLYLLADIDDVR